VLLLGIPGGQELLQGVIALVCELAQAGGDGRIEMQIETFAK